MINVSESIDKIENLLERASSPTTRPERSEVLIKTARVHLDLLKFKIDSGIS